MAKQTYNRIAEIRKSRGLTQAALADQLGAHWITISKLERGRMQLSLGWMIEIAKALNVKPEDLIAKERIAREVHVVGSLEPDGSYFDFGEESWMVEIPIDPHQFESGYWVIVEGNHFSPMFRDSDRLQFVLMEERQADIFRSRFCLVEDQSEVIHPGYVIACREGGFVDLQPINGPLKLNIDARTLSMLVEVRFSWPQDIREEYRGEYKD